MARFAVIGVVVLVVVATGAGCSARKAVQPGAGTNPACLVLPTPDFSPDTITVAIPSTVLSAAGDLQPTSTTFFPLDDFYENLVQLDCLGRPIPGLAQSWVSKNSDQQWEFTLRENATFWDGEVVTPKTITSVWQEAIEKSTEIGSVSVDRSRLIVYLRRPSDTVPPLLSDPRFTLSKVDERTHRRVGTGPYRLIEEAGEFLGVPTDNSDTSRPVIRFIPQPEGDLRDILGHPVDLLITDDPSTIAYAAASRDFSAEALPWTRTYLLLSPTRIDPNSIHSPLPGATLSRLASDAVRESARGASLMSWLESNPTGSDDCSGAWSYEREDRINPDALVPQILYRQDDPVARQLAERIVGVAAAGPDAGEDAAAFSRALPGLVDVSQRLRAVGVSDPEFDALLREGSRFGYILAVPVRALDRCRAVRRLAARVPWMDAAPAFGTAGASTVALPLIDTRQTVIATSRRFGIRMDFLGRLKIVTNSMERREP